MTHNEQTALDALKRIAACDLSGDARADRMTMRCIARDVVAKLEASQAETGLEAHDLPYGVTVDQYDFPEDFSGENGMYENFCTDCGVKFLGHKRRVTCKVCAETGQECSRRLTPTPPAHAYGHTATTLEGKPLESTPLPTVPVTSANEFWDKNKGSLPHSTQWDSFKVGFESALQLPPMQPSIPTDALKAILENYGPGTITPDWAYDKICDWCHTLKEPNHE